MVTVDLFMWIQGGFYGWPFLTGFRQLDLNSPFTSLDTEIGLSTTAYLDTYRFESTLYFTTNNGSCYLEDEREED